MLPFLSVLSLAKKAYNFKQSRNNVAGGEKAFTESKKTPMTAIGKLRLFIALPIILTAIALLLAILCVFTGSKPGMMDNYAVFTLNTSRLGENVLADIDGGIKSLGNDLKFDKREVVLTATAPVALITPAPTTMLTLVPRNILSDAESKLSSKAHSAKSNVSSKASAVQSEVSSKAASATSAAKGAVNSGISSSQDKIIELVNKAFHAAIDGLDLHDITAVHISSSCSGTYVYKTSKNYTADDTKDLDQLRPHIDSCASHSAVNPFQLVRIIYWIGVVFSAVALILGLAGVVEPTKKMALINIFGTLPAVIFMGLASAVTHGMAVGAAHLITFIGDKIGVTGVAGQKFVQLTWATTILLLVNLCLWAVVFFLLGRMAKSAAGGAGDRKRPDRTSAIVMNQFPEISRPLPAHTDRNGHAMI
jgi:hypothetical protein